MSEAVTRFACFGGECAVLVSGDGPLGTPEAAVTGARRRLLRWHARFSRFTPDSELSRLNADPGEDVAVSRDLARLAAAVRAAAELTGGLVDATLVDLLEAAGYAGEPGPAIALADALRDAPPRRPAAPRPDSRWRDVSGDPASGQVRRPLGVRIDSGGLAKGLFADLLADSLRGHGAFAVDCSGDLRIGGTAGRAREVRVEDPFDGRTLLTWELARGGVATSGIGRRSWRGPDGAPAHHLLDPATGRPAFTGVVQATALAPTALEAEARAKAALLSGPRAAPGWLPHGGVVVHDDGTHATVPPSRLPGSSQLGVHNEVA